jgi:hypothetical protein
VIATTLVLADCASVTVIVQAPGVVEAMYVKVACPIALVGVEIGLRVPQVGPPLADAITGSFTTSMPAPDLTVTVTVDVLVPLAGTAGGVAATLTVFAGGIGFAVCVIVADPRPPVDASVATTVQNPTVVVAV